MTPATRSSASEQGLSSPELPVQVCPSCGDPNMRSYCGVCGERRAHESDYSFRAFAGQALSTFTDVDSRLIRSFRALITRPGFLTHEHLAGRRRLYLSPLQLFLLANVLFFFAQGVVSTTVLTTPLNTHLHQLPHSDLATSWVAERLEAREIAYETYAARFDAAVATQAKSLVIIMVPLFALLSWLVNLGTRRSYVVHLIHSLYFYAFFLLWAVAIGVAFAAVHRAAPANSWALWVLSNADPISVVLALVIFGTYLYIASRSAFGRSLPWGIINGVVLCVGFVYILYIYRLALFFTVFLTT